MTFQAPRSFLAILLAVALVPSLAMAKKKRSRKAAERANTALALDTPTETTPSPPPPPPPAPVAEAMPTPPPEEPSDAQAEASPVEETPPVAEEPKEATPTPEPESPPSYVEHLGPSSYPGKTRGLVGGSLDLEPSFHGLQWPVMRHTGVGVSGSVWVDTGYESITRRATSPDTVRLLQQARAVVRATPTYANGNFFIQGQVELVGNNAQTKSQSSNVGLVDIDDLWIRIGGWNKWDLKAGRFEGWELYHTGMGLDMNTLERRGATQQEVGGTDLLVPDFYGVSYLFYRPSGEGMGNVALHFYPSEILRFELLGRVGTTDSQANGLNQVGARPMAILDLGWLKFKVAGEYAQTQNGQSQYDAETQSKAPTKEKLTQRGVGSALQLILDPIVEFGVNFGYGQVRGTGRSGNTLDTGSYNTTSVGGFANYRVANDYLLGAGANWTVQYDKHYSATTGHTNYTAHLQAFAALQYHIAGQLYAKAVFAYARSDFMPSFSDTNEVWSNEMLSGRLRLLYLY